MDLKLHYAGVKHLIRVALVLFILIGFQTNTVFAQDTEVKEVKKDKKEKKEKDSGKIGVADKKAGVAKYRRSSLHTMIIEDAKLPKIDVILKTFKNAEFPDKYNNHTVGDKSFDLAKYYVAPVADEGEKLSKKESKDLSLSINKYFEENKVANKIVAKWFDRSPEGAFDMNLIGERGMYDASAQAAATAASTERGTSMLADAGEELIPNTFVVVNYSEFIENEPVAKGVRDAAYSTVKDQDKDAIGRLIVEKAADKLYEKTKDGYIVLTTAYLYQLEWTDSMSAVFYQDLWMDTTSIDPTKKEAFDNTDLFHLKLLGYQKAKAFIAGVSKNATDINAIVETATLRSINSVYAKLQRKFEPFRTKTPLVSADPLGAKIGLKEGLEAGDKYEVLEQVADAEGKITYKRKGVIKVEKGKIWNNMYSVGEEPVDEEGNPIKVDSSIEFTHFKGGKGYYPGMLLRQIN